MLDLGTHAGLSPIGFLVGGSQRSVPVGTPVGEILRLRRQRFQPLTLCLAAIGTVAIETGFLAMQQIRHFVTVMHVGRRNARAMDQSALAVGTNVRLHAEVPLVPFLGLVHLWIARFVPVLGRRRRSDQGGIHDGASGQPHAVADRTITCSKVSYAVSQIQFAAKAACISR